ncbi:hypothetical protein PGT21_024591 [Puccinia graminis f. sp. tritici]|uniref:Uncharacterized protein n=1 Tax=Puccinia graminis f. sp. tritici TaxID=56615 RepID=A0A5B0NWP1_PUCGR|nr:hypothetical protein PGT21_024591 [Puccinia graminis f. sp. tritici]KAA1127715.1 hypothetical protein PGTUg99_001230 [Puccinia graminis f. sp. tritici]
MALLQDFWTRTKSPSLWKNQPRASTTLQSRESVWDGTEPQAAQTTMLDEHVPFPESDFIARQNINWSRLLTQNLLEDDFEITAFLDSSGNSEPEILPQSKKRRPNKEQSHVENHQRLMADYFNEESTYDS